jgi:Family of unknown function (DUF5519)
VLEAADLLIARGFVHGSEAREVLLAAAWPSGQEYWVPHLHGDHAAHFGFPTDIWSALFDEGRIDYHPVFAGRAGFGARRIETEVVDQVIAIMRINYERVIARHGVPSGTAA